MQRFIIIRFVQALVALFAVSIIVFSLARISGDPLDTLLSFESGPEQRAAVAKYWGLDRPLPEQYLKFIGNAFQGDFGTSFKWRLPVMDLINDRLWNTVQLAGLSLVVATVVALPLGVLSAVKRDTPLDYLGKLIALIGQAAPQFWVGLVLIMIFAVRLELVQTSGKGGFSSYILPAITEGMFYAAAIMRITRSAMLDVLDSEYVKLARIKGLAEWKVIWKHVLRNAAIAPLTLFGLIMGSVLLGAVATETVFAWPGLGFLAFDAVTARDYPLIQAVVLVFSIIFIAVNLFVDVLYAYLDPRIRYQ
jgi:peptide/nickel transport system permease protein